MLEIKLIPLLQLWLLESIHVISVIKDCLVSHILLDILKLCTKMKENIVVQYVITQQNQEVI